MNLFSIVFICIGAVISCMYCITLVCCTEQRPRVAELIVETANNSNQPVAEETITSEKENERINDSV